MLTGLGDRPPLAAMRRGLAARVPLIHGNNRDEMRPFVAVNYDIHGHPVTADQYPGILAQVFGADAAEVLARYPASAYPSPGVALATVLTDGDPERVPARGSRRATTSLRSGGRATSGRASGPNRPHSGGYAGPAAAVQQRVQDPAEIGHVVDRTALAGIRRNAGLITAQRSTQAILPGVDCAFYVSDLAAGSPASPLTL